MQMTMARTKIAADPAVKPLVCREWGKLRVGENGLTEAEAGQFHALAERAGRHLKLGKDGVLVRTRSGLKAQQVVGVLAVPGRTLEILPKIDGQSHDVRDALVHMLAVAHDLRVVDSALAGMARQSHDLLELLIRLFANRLLAAVLRGLPRRYVAREDDLRLLRGRLDVVRQFTRHAVRPDRLACRFDELSEDTPLNRVLKAAVSRLANATRSAANARVLPNWRPASNLPATLSGRSKNPYGSTGPTPLSTTCIGSPGCSSKASGRAPPPAGQRASLCCFQ